ncbi:ABC transporter permease [Arthrobacter sp. zg-Y1110]|uniref:ABC transporter permease n=1 Tax=Arthrobacter sp. zg-Y1110 TaxID=2886932 RepID=UPI001D14955B|nr:ABC transporter permease [Arthrobacter sp. zg-Y1110]MCC3291040.1 ABC transporter permease [Arthrobacter sp. zg-Y1110]UWX86448.1 ABC transporter permease [Arthrobacter sp. zg-Y1110]
MYLALRDIRFAKGRFALMGSVVALITLLLVLLSGLTAGLGNQNTAAIKDLGSAGVDIVAFGAPEGGEAKVSYTESTVTAEQLAEWRKTPGIETAEPVGITQTRITGGASANVAVFGVEPGSKLAPRQIGDGQILIGSETAESLSLDAGDEVRLGGRVLTVEDIVDQSYYSHTPLVWTSLATWQAAAHTNDEGSDAAPVATVIAASGSTAEQADDAAGTVSTGIRGSFNGLGAYTSENGSLLMMQAFLYGISALVIVAFLAVWTIQRTRDIAVLKALGGSSAYLMRDALAQAGVIVAAGAVTGGVLAVLIGLAAAAVAPFILTVSTALLPILGIVVLGLAGAAGAVRRVAKVDPLTALGGN